MQNSSFQHAKRVIIQPMMNTPLTFARVLATILRDERRNRGSQKSLSKLLGISQSAYSKIESGEAELGLSEAILLIRTFGFEAKLAIEAAEFVCDRIASTGQVIFGFSAGAQAVKKSELGGLNEVITLMMNDPELRPLFHLVPARSLNHKFGYGLLGVLIEYLDPKRREQCINDAKMYEISNSQLGAKA